MKKILGPLALLMLCLATDLGAAPNRTPLMPLFLDPTGDTQIFAERNTIRALPDGAEVRVHMLFTPSRDDPYDENGIYHEFDEPVSRVIDTVRVSCPKQTYTLISSEFFNIHDVIIWSIYDLDVTLAVEPDRISGLVYNLICRGQAAPKQST